MVSVISNLTTMFTIPHSMMLLIVIFLHKYIVYSTLWCLWVSFIYDFPVDASNVCDSPI